MSEIVKKICVGEDTKTLVLKIHGDLGKLEVNSCDSDDKKDSSKDKGSNKKVKGEDKDLSKKPSSDSCSGKTDNHNKPRANISLIGRERMTTNIQCVSSIKDGYLAGGYCGGDCIITEIDQSLNFKKVITIRMDTIGHRHGKNVYFGGLLKVDDNYVMSVDYANGFGFIAWDSNYKTISSYHIYYITDKRISHAHTANNLYKTGKDFSGEAAYLCSYGIGTYGSFVVAFDKNYKMIKFVSTSGQNSMDVVAYKDKIVGISSMDNKGYLFVADSNLTVNKHIVYTVDKTTCHFNKIVKTEYGYLVLGNLNQQVDNGSIFLLKLDEEFKILDKKDIRYPFMMIPNSFNQRPDGGYLISGEMRTKDKRFLSFMKFLDKDLNIENGLMLRGSKYETFSSSYQKEDGTYVAVGETRYNGNGFILTFKGDISKLNEQKMEKYPSLFIDCNIDYKVHTDMSVEVNDKSTFSVNDKALILGQTLRFDSISSDGEIRPGLFLQDPEMIIG